MTSSLVGSEMCIRDRPLAARWGYSFLRNAIEQWWRKWRSQRAVADPYETSSGKSLHPTTANPLRKGLLLGY
eukprot:4547458-Prorocentrum_lima.AAC.1